ncbi:hypothetical protein ACEQ6A_09505 [Rhizobium brockwellii]|uniref:DUF6932 family protein n=1 Tax=Rhizobium brockwellii TaxID=3019932 RepID=UPI003F9A4C09
MIPSWNLAGLIPPIRAGELGNGLDRSPYNATFSEVVIHFGTSPDRIAILTGLLNYRQELYDVGINEGFQWLDGSFMEDVETLKGRSRNDVDVVTFFRLPKDQTQESLLQRAPHLFDVEHTKQQYRVDGYPMVLGHSLEDWHVRQISYWYSMWSHTRERSWKGFVRVDLDLHEDGIGRQLLEAMQAPELEL